MSGIYIPNVNLPESCDNCPHPTCRLWQNVNGGERHEKCPIVFVPDHGRLGDLDKLVAAYDAEHVGPPGRARELMMEAPTVIPADKEAET